MSRLNNKVALITGAASNPGLGRAIALTFAREGAKLVISDVNAEGLASCYEEVKALGGEVLQLHQDVTSESGWEEAISAAEAEYGQLDILVNNAGIAVLRNTDEMTLEDFERQMRVNMTSVFLGCKHGVKAMRRAGGGSIINLSSVAGLVGIPGTGAYGASKGGVRLLSKTVALENARQNIRCNSIHPGVIWTNIQQDAIRDNPGQYEIINDSIPMGRMGQPEDVANCALFLASDESSYVSGVELTVDGCLTAQ
ncbi:glucose 1-dehydrogenase [Aestuariicella hydrocarbonica]|uniref:Glucose 1-dehydrogenase n=1 Tax=Pseudomaricurvus hydrocarbonicus TaxID=1470433 RepID=A0A9E5JXP1_9GAMM|nr:glucose 1-dehydrogenase [Aestuariicella hydrocarbonica]NHO66865.1 glucose 1-dehydrogenase [Aestuariicella hydrocarbonica]